MNLRHDLSALSPSGVHNPIVIVVDDDAGMRAYIRQCLEVLPLHIAEAVDGLDALEQIRTGQGDVALIISDIYMPRMDGLELKAALAADPRCEQVPVLLITGEAIRARNRPMLRKPFNARKLRAVVQALLDLS